MKLFEQALVPAFTTALDVHVGTKVPNPRPDVWVRLTLVGYDRPNLGLSRIRMQVECQATTQDAAWETCSAAIELVESAPHEAGQTLGMWVHDTTVTGVANNPDTETGEARYQFVAEILTADNLGESNA